MNKALLLACCVLPFWAGACHAASSQPRRTELVSMALSGTLPDADAPDAYFDVLMALSVPGSSDVDRSALLRLQGGLEQRLGGDAVQAAQKRVAAALRRLLDKDLEDMKRAADSGVMDAQADLADVYDRGIGVGPDPVLAEKYARLSAEQGYARAQFMLWRILLRNGQGVEARSWLEKAAAQNDVPAQFSLALLLLSNGDRKNEERAMQLVSQTASIGYPPALAYMAESFASGQNFPKDMQSAAMWARMALESGELNPDMEARMQDILAGSAP